MPQGSLPASGSLKDPDVKTPDYQDRIGLLLDYVREIEAELSQLSSQEIKSGAVKDASQASTGETLQLRKSDGRGGDVADPSSNADPVNLQHLDQRLGTSGNLDTAALRKADQNLRQSDDVQFGKVNSSSTKTIVCGYLSVSAGVVDEINQSTTGKDTGLSVSVSFTSDRVVLSLSASKTVYCATADASTFPRVCKVTGVPDLGGTDVNVIVKDESFNTLDPNSNDFDFFFVIYCND